MDKDAPVDLSFSLTRTHTPKPTTGSCITSNAGRGGGHIQKVQKCRPADRQTLWNGSRFIGATVVEFTLGVFLKGGPWGA